MAPSSTSWNGLQIPLTLPPLAFGRGFASARTTMPACPPNLSSLGLLPMTSATATTTSTTSTSTFLPSATRSSQTRRRKSSRLRPRASLSFSTTRLFSEDYEHDHDDDDRDLHGNQNQNARDAEKYPEETEQDFCKRQLAHLESLEEMLAELEQGIMYEDDDDDDNDEDDEDMTLDDSLYLDQDDEDVEDLLSILETADDDDDDDDQDIDREEEDDQMPVFPKELLNIYTKPTDPNTAAQSLELALREGVVPADAGVGSNCLAGDFGWDPLDLASQDYILPTQRFLLRWLPGGQGQPEPEPEYASAEQSYILPQRPTALILRDYRQAEIRHGRLAMLAAMIWPVQEMLDGMLLEPEQFGPLLFGQYITLPYFPLFMTLCMMGLGYLDIYAAAIKDRDEIGEAFLPGDCFWDPLRILEGAPASMKRNMQERELFNGRVAMLAIAAFLFEEGTTHLPLISIEGNELLLEPAFAVPFIQEWLDLKFAPAIYSTMLTLLSLTPN
jgi:hypothetical protein